MTSDGRTARVEAGRRQVGAALMALIREQGRLPDVATVAARAGVSRRSVFRYFDGVRALELATAEAMRQYVTTALPPPEPAGGPLQERLLCLATHRMQLFEWVTPIRLLLDAARLGGNPDLDAFIDASRRLLREHAAKTFAPELSVWPDRLAAVDLATSWEGWHALRQGQRLAPEDARAEIVRLVTLILSG